MKHCFITKQRTLLVSLCITVVCLLSAYRSAAQTVNCALSANCGNAYCSFAPTIEKGCNCFDGIDNDDDDVIDQADSNCATYYGLIFVGEGTNCSIVPPGNADPFDLINVPLASAQNTADTQSKVSVGDVDGDGIPDAVITSKWNSELRVIATRAGQPDGTVEGKVKSDFNLSGNAANVMFSDAPTTGPCAPNRLLFEHENLIADIDGNGKAEIYGVASNRGGNPETPPTCFYLVGFTYAPDDLVPLFKAVNVGTDRPGTFGIADMDGDGKAEIYLRDRIYAAETGALLAQAGGNWDLDVTSAPVAVNISGDTKMELVCGTKIYSIPSLSNRNPATPAALTLLHDMNAITTNDAYVKLMSDPTEYGLDTHSSCSVADIDRDGNVDVVISGALNDVYGPTTVFYWNVIKNTVSMFSPPDDTYPNGWVWGTGRVNLGDANGDGRTDFSFIAGSKLWCLTTDVAGNLVPLWASPRTINDSRSGVLTVTIYDFNNDGDPEMVYRDSQILAVIDGTTGTQLLWSSVCQSHTYTEGPVIADVNGDGGTDICVTCYTNSVAGSVNDVSVTAVGSGYTTGTVSFVGGGGSGATADITFQGGKVKSIKITNAGTGYSSAPTVVITGNGTGATATATIADGSFSVNDGLQQQALGQYRLYYSAANDWLPTRKVWNQPGYFVVNIKDNLQLPFPQLDQTLIFSDADCPNGLPGPQMPMNVFLNQVPYLSAEGCPVFPAPDLSYFGDNPDTPGVDVNGDGVYLPAVEVVPPICGNLAIQVRFRIVNDGDLPLTLNVPVSFWKADPTLGTTTQADKLFTTNINVSNLAVDATLLTSFVSFNGTGGTFRLYIVLNNSGATLPINLSAPSSTECRLQNNMYSVDIVPDPFTTKIEKIQDNFKCVNTAPNTGELRVRIFKGGIEETDYSQYGFQWYTGLATAPPVAIAGATNYNITGLAEGDYSALVRNTVKNCTGVFVDSTIVRTGVDPDVVITAVNQTLCNPANGSLTATVQGIGGNTGYTFKWYDQTLQDLGITGSVANNMVAGSYKLIISKSGCSKQIDAPPILPPNKPDAQASVLAHVVDCINPNSGSVTADAVFNAVVQNPANYTFTWYFYNNASVPPARGSVLPAANGTGQTRTALPAGYYQVTIRDNATQCDANQSPIVQITSQTVLPTALITRTKEQTSCDLTKPNGALTASATGGTFVSPTDFTFEWFRGPNTLPENKIPNAGGPETLSGAKSEILNSAKGGGQVYTVRVTTPNNCSATTSETVIVNVIEPVLTLTELTPNSVCDVTKASNPYNGSIQGTVTFAGNTITLPDPNYKFTWYDGTTTTTLHNPVPANLQNPILTGLRDGNYAATVERTDLFCTSVPKTVPVTKATILPILSATSTGSNNCDPALTPDGTVTVSVTNTLAAPGPFTYQWYAGNAVGVSPLGAANNGTTATAIKVGGPVGAPNQYTVEVLNTATGCVNNTTQFVADVSVIPVLSFGLIKPNTICAPITSFNGEMNAQVTNIPAGYTLADYTFRWFDGQTPTAILHNPPSTTAQLTGLEAAFYTVDARNTKTGCQSAPISNQVPNGKIFPLLQPSSTGSNNCDPALTPDGTVTYTVTNIQPGDAFSQQWYNGSSVTLGQELPAANNGTSVTAIKVGGPTGAPKPYTVLVTNTVTGCTNFTTAAVPDISIVPVLTTAVVANSICAPASAFNGSFTANVSNIPALYTLADYDFTFRNAANVIVQASSADNSLNNVDAGAYSVVGRNRVTGCTSAVANNNVPNLKVFPSLTPSSTGSDNCVIIPAEGIVNNGTASVAVAVTPGPHTFQWYSGSGDPIATPLTPLPAANAPNAATAIGLGGPVGAPNAYTVLVTDVPSGCTSFTTAFVADESVIPVLAFGPITPNTICSPSTLFDGSMTVQVSNIGSFALTDFAFTWFDDAALATPHATQPPAATDHLLTLLDVEDYTVRARNTRTGCISAPITGQVPDGKINPLVSVTTTGSHNCTTGPGITPDGTATATITNNALGDPMSFAWSAVAPATALGVANTPTAATATLLGGPTNAPNAYNVIVTNTRTGCVGNGQGLVADLSQKPVPVLAAFENHVCNPLLITQTTANYDGHVDITAVNHNGAPVGPAGLTYQWRDVDAANVVGALIGGQTSAILPNRPAGKYAAVVTITSLGCTSDPVIEEVLDDLTPPDITPAVSPNTNCPGGGINANGSAAVTLVDAVAVPSVNYTIQWHTGAIVGAPIGGATNPLLGNQITGTETFTAEVTNRLTGCVASEPMTVTDARVLPTIAVTFVQNNTNCTGTPNGALLATPANAGATFTVNWTPAVTVTGVGNINNTELPAGAYSATVTNTVTGCVSLPDGQNIIDDFTYPSIAVTITDQTSCNVGAPNGAQAVTVVGGVGYEWFDGAGTGTPHVPSVATSITNLASGDFTVRATFNATGCAATQTNFVPENVAPPVVTLTNTQQVTTCGTSPNGEVAAVITGLVGGPAFPSVKYDIFYVFTEKDGTYPTTTAPLLASADKIVDGTVIPVPDHTGLYPGYMTAYVIDKNTSCASVLETVQILDDLETYEFTIDSKQQAGLCGGGGGGISVTVERSDLPGVDCATCTYEWYPGSPTNTDINFFDNLPIMAGGQLTVEVVNEDLGNPAYAPGVGAGTYTLIVKDTDPAHLGCGNYKTDFVPPSSQPDLTYTLTHITDCVTPNGQIAATVDGGTSTLGYTIRIFEGTDATGLLKANLAVPADPANVLTLADLTPGEYYIEGKDNDAVNINCPFGEVVTLEQIVAPPILTLTSVGANTSCDPLASADGSVTIRVDNAAGDTEPKIYSIADPIAPPVVGYATPNLVGAAGASGESETITGMSPVDYTITVIDANSSCETDILITIPNVQDVPDVIAATPFAETLCATGSDGRAVVAVANTPAVDLVQFDFTWAQANDMTLPVYTASGDGTGTQGELLNRTHAIANTPGNFWPMGGAGQGSGARTFFVQGVKNATAPSGVGCKTGIVQVVIPDEHVTPDMTLTPFFDSFCLATAGNNAVGDGKITVVADADPSTGGQEIPAGGFSYAWTPLPIGSTTGSPNVSAVASYDINQLHDGNYTVTVTNPLNFCQVQNTVTIAPAPFVLTIDAAAVIDQRVCNNDGRIEITQVRLTDNSVGSPASATDNTPALIDARYSFRWYNNAALTAGTELEDANAPDDITHKVLGHDADGDFLPEEDDYGSMQAGTYYVVATRTNNALPGFGCPTLPFQVVVNDVHVNPVPSLAVLSNTSCLPAGPGEGQITITMTDNTPAPFSTNTFTYDWIAPGPIPPAPNVDPTVGANGDGLGADDQFINLIDNATLANANPYTVSITNTVTGCVTSAFATIIKNATPVFVQNVTVADEILCSPTGDGSLTVTRVTLNDRTGASQDFVAAPAGPQGNISNFSFEWQRVGNTFTQTTAGTTLNNANYDTDPSPGGFGNVIGAGTYRVTARRSVGSPGAGCPSAPFEVVIKNLKINPVVSLTPLANTSCATLPGDMEGEIKLKATDATTAPGVTGFTYTWTTPALTPIGPGAGDADGFGGGENDGVGIDNDSDHPRDLVDGAYSVSVRSNKSGCTGIGTATILKNTTPIFIQNVTVLNQILCGPDGQLTVASVTLNDRDGITQTFPPNISDFEFTWTRTGIAGSQVTAGTVLNPANYVAANFANNPFGLGQYTVVARRNSNGPGNGCSSAPYSVSVLDRRIFPVVTLTPFANTSCSLVPADFEGEIEVRVADATPAGFALGYDYTWNAGTGTAIASANPANNGNGVNDVDDDNPRQLREGTYSITVLNNASGCTSTGLTEIFKNSTPVFTQLVTPTDQVLCSADGRLVVNEVRVIDRDQNVQSSNTDFPIGDFEFTYSRTTVGGTIAGVTGTQLNVGNYPTIGADVYFVVARRTAGGPGLNCTSPPYKVDILNKQLFPVVSLTPFANTSCDPTFFEGEIEVRVTDNSVNIPAPLTGLPFNYQYTWTTSATPAVINGLVAGAHDGDGDGSDGDGDHPLLLVDGAYAIQVRNNITNCISTGSTTIFKNSTPVFTQLVTPVHQILCNPDGSLTVNEVKVIDRDGNVESNLTGDFPLTDFRFNYDRTTIGNPIAPAVTGSVLNNVTYPTIGIDDYYVVATRVAGGPGLNCSSAPYKVSIEDRRVFPTVSFTSLANSSCNVTLPNGSVTANAAEPNGSNVGPYTFAWTLNAGPISPSSTLNNTANSSQVVDALDGGYIVTATNTITGCPFDASFNLKLDQTMSTPNIIEVLTDDPLDCNPTAGAEVTKITLGSTSVSILFPPNIPPDNVVSGADLLNFTYNWYKGGTTPADQLPAGGPPFLTTPCIGPNCATPTTGVTAGTYFVTVLDPRTDCQSGPKEVVINDDDIIYPELIITQTRLQVSCIGGVGSAELQATADGFNGTNANYVFNWFTNLDATPPSAATGSTFSNLVAGDYSAEVFDQTTGCTSEAFYIVPDDTPRFLPQISLSTDPRVNCLANDGTLLAREIGFNPNNGYPFPSNYSAEFYVGANANVTGPGTPMPNEPGFIRNWISTGMDIGPYTVKIIDNNTGCIVTDEISVADGRVAPIVVILQENPLINCDPARPNGQLSATADQGRIGGYAFDWFRGTTATGSVIEAQNILIGETAGQYTVRVTNDITGCFKDEVGEIRDGRLPAPTPLPEVVFHKTRCVAPFDGWVTATVDGVVINYAFEWYDGENANGAIAFDQPDYNKRDDGFYTVKVMDITTGCYSEPATIEVLDRSEIPQLVFTTTSSFCEDLPDSFTKGNGSVQVEMAPAYLFSDSIAWIKVNDPGVPVSEVTDEGSLVEVTPSEYYEGAYVTDLFPGFYKANVETVKGCTNWGLTEVKTEIRAYNLVTRNTDGKNDAFVVDCISRFPNNNVKIFNRAGVKVYEADGYDNNEKVFRGLGENGVYTTGNDLPVGTYFYIIDKRDGSKPKTGYLELVK
jgi:hypothetical protein